MVMDGMDNEQNALVGLYDHFLGPEGAYLDSLRVDAKRALHGLETGLMLKSKSANGEMSDFELVIPKFAITLMCARTGGGKTTCMTDLTVRLCLKGKKGFFITLEEPAFAINSKMLASYSRKVHTNHSMDAVTVGTAFKVLAGKEQSTDMDGFKKNILKHCRVIDANSTVDLGKVSSPTIMYDPQYIADLIRYRNDKAHEPLDFVVIDFGQLMETGGGENSQVYMRLKAVMQAAKNMAGSLGIAVIMGAQLRREVVNLDIWDWEPEHIRDGSDIEQAASLILATGVDKKHPDPEYQTAIRFLKNRYGPKRVAGMFRVEYEHCHFPNIGMEPHDD